MDKSEAINSALNFANDTYGKNRAVKFVLCDEREIIEDEDIWYIPFIEEKIENRKVWVGAFKGVIIDKKTGEIFQPGSAYRLEIWIWGFKLGFRDGRVDFTVISINDESKTIEFLYELGIQYVVPELKNGTVWTVPKTYNRKEIKSRISKLPCTFKNQGLTISLFTIQEIVQSNAFEFEIKPTDYDVEGIYGELIDKDRLIK